MKFSRPDIFQYHDYRVFLKDWVEWLKVKRGGYSLRTLATEAGFSCAYLPLILAGKRKLTEKGQRKLIPVIQISQQEKSYLVLMIQAIEGSKDEQAQALEQMQRLKAYRSANPRETEVFRYLTRWFYVALRELTALPQFQPDPKWIQEKLQGNLSLEEVEQALHFLVTNDFLKPDAQGKLRATEKDIRCIGQVFSSALRKFHHQMIGISLNALDTSPKDSHLIMGHTTTLSKKQFPKVQRILENALREIEKLGQEEKDPDSVYHVGLLAAPLTQK